MTPQAKSAVIALHEANDSLVEVLKRNPDFKPACYQCTSGACCSEATLADWNEADFILDNMTEAEREALKPRVLAWFEATHQLRTLRHTSTMGLAWRFGNVTCPLLTADKRCSVYANRPTGCRMFFAKQNPENCEMPMRLKQQFAVLDHTAPFQIIMVQYLNAVGELRADHLALPLYNRLFGKSEESAAAQGYKLEAEETNT